MRICSLIRLASLSLMACIAINGCSPKVEEGGPLPGATATAQTAGNPDKPAGDGLAALQQASDEGSGTTPTGEKVVPAVAKSDTSAAPDVVAVPSGPSVAEYSLPIEFTVRASVMGWDTVNLRSYPVSVDNGFAFSGLLDGGRSPRSFDVTRFAHFGNCDSPYIFKWVLYMPEVGELSYEPGRATGGKKEVSLKGKLNFDIILKSATKALEMRARMVPIFRGTTNTWPPNTMTLTLVNGPIPFFKIDRLHDSGSHPMLTVLEAKYVVGKGTTKFFTRTPKIIRATRAKGSTGVQLEWNGTADQLKPATISGYAIYRSADPSDPKSWREIGTVPATQTNYVDNEYDGRSRVSYAVTHRMEYPPFYNYEGMLSAPVAFDPVPQ